MEHPIKRLLLLLHHHCCLHVDALGANLAVHTRFCGVQGVHSLLLKRPLSPLLGPECPLLVGEYLTSRSLGHTCAKASSHPGRNWSCPCCNWNVAPLTVPSHQLLYASFKQLQQNVLLSYVHFFFMKSRTPFKKICSQCGKDCFKPVKPKFKKKGLNLFPVALKKSLLHVLMDARVCLKYNKICGLLMHTVNFFLSIFLCLLYLRFYFSMFLCMVHVWQRSKETKEKLSIKNKIKHQVVFLESLNSMSKVFKLVSSMKVTLKFWDTWWFKLVHRNWSGMTKQMYTLL